MTPLRALALLFGLLVFGQQAHAIDNQRTPAGGKRPPSAIFNVRDFGARGNGTDDTVAIRAAVTAAQVKGGTVLFPTPGRYAITSQINIKSIYPVNLISDMFGYTDQSSTGNWIMPGANFGGTSIFHYEAPSGSHSNRHGGGVIRGLAFYDPFNASYTPHYTMLAALDLYDFNLGSVENCMFHVLNGGAIRAVNMVQGNIHNIEVRYSGTASIPAISLEPTGGAANVQSTAITSSRIEANYGTYLKLNSTAAQIKIANVGFEAVPGSTPSTSYTFIDDSGQETFISNVHFNRNSVTQYISQAAANFLMMSNVNFLGDNTQTTASASIASANATIHGLSVRNATAQTTAAVNVTGAFDIIDDVNILHSGGISISGNAYIYLSNFIVESPNSGAGSYAVDCSSQHCQVANGLIYGLPVNMGGVRISGSAVSALVSGVEVRDATGTGVGFRDENTSNTTTWANNRGYNNAADFSWSNTSFVATGNQFGTTVQITPWITPTLLNSWVVCSGTSSQPGYYKDANNIVHLKGCVKSGTTATSAIFTLPAGYRPTFSTIQPVTINGGTGITQVSASSGSVTPQVGSTVLEYMDGIHFPAEQ